MIVVTDSIISSDILMIGYKKPKKTKKTQPARHGDIRGVSQTVASGDKPEK
jgi:hypothetical protein